MKNSPFQVAVDSDAQLIASLKSALHFAAHDLIAAADAIDAGRTVCTRTMRKLASEYLAQSLESAKPEESGENPGDHAGDIAEDEDRSPEPFAHTSDREEPFAIFREPFRSHLDRKP